MAVTRDSLLAEIRAAIDQNAADRMQHSLGYWGPNSASLGTQASNSANKITQLKDLLGMMGSSEAESSANPFAVGGAGGAPTVSTDNRFAAGLSDVESRLRALLDNPDSITNSAAYKFRVNQGQEALQRSLGAKGLLNSGNRLMELTKYGQDMGSQEYDNQYGRLASLLGNYSQGYIGDKNANTNLFGAQATAWNQAQANNDRNRLGYAQLAWDKQKDGGRVIGRSSGGMTVPAGTLGGFGGNIGMGNTGFGSLATADDPYNTGFGIRDVNGNVSGRSAF